MGSRLTTVESSIKAIKEDSKKAAHGVVDKESITTSVYEELREREERRGVLLIHGLPEPDSALKGAEDRIAADITKLQSLLREIEVDDNKDNIKFAARLGDRPKGNDSKPRPLRVGFKSVQLRADVFESSKKLNSSDGWEEVSIIPDLTKIQREGEKKLRDDAAKRNEERGEEEKNFEWKVVGLRGERRLIKAKAAPQTGRPAATGGLRGRSLRPR